jgi:transposase
MALDQSALLEVLDVLKAAEVDDRSRQAAETIYQALIGAELSCGRRATIHTFTRGLDLDAQAVIAAVTLPFHNGRTEGVNTKTKMIKRQMYGRAGFTLLRHRILLG